MSKVSIKLKKYKKDSPKINFLASHTLFKQKERDSTHESQINKSAIFFLFCPSMAHSAGAIPSLLSHRYVPKNMEDPPLPTLKQSQKKHIFSQKSPKNLEEGKKLSKFAKVDGCASLHKKLAPFKVSKVKGGLIEIACLNNNQL